MKIVRIIGGLGNQLFQYAFLVGIRYHSGDEVKVDLSAMNKYSLHNGFELNNLFCLSSGIASKEEVKRLGRFYNSYRQWQICHHFFPFWKKEFVEWRYTHYYSRVLSEASKDRLYDGYWQCYNYFDDARDEILKEYTYKEELDQHNSMIASAMLNDKESVSIHVRRGDYLKIRKYKGICELDYYQRAIRVMKEKVGQRANIYIFSNDINWCIDNLMPELKDYKVTFVDWNRGKESYKDMRLMHYCRLNIIAASSFSWWGAYLNRRPDQIVIAPQKWVNLKMDYSIQLPHWIKV